MENQVCAIGVDLGGTKIEIGLINLSGVIHDRIRLETDVKGGVQGIERQIIESTEKLKRQANFPVIGMGIGVAGQIEALSGSVRFSPNLKWHNVPLQENLSRKIKLPIIVTNDVRAATWGEWFLGSGRGCQDLICLFIGTGIGGGIVSGGRILSGDTNTCGEVGHMTVDLNGPRCTCGNLGCLEALAGGWAIAYQAKNAIRTDPERGGNVLKLAHQIELIQAKHVIESYRNGDELSKGIINQAIQALIGGAVGLVNAFNPHRLILGGGIVEGLPELISIIQEEIKKRALSAAVQRLEVLPAYLGNDSGVVGAAAMAIHQIARREG
jgi:glucokinase